MTFEIFIDSNIILDVLSESEPFYDSAAVLFSLIEEGQIIGYTSRIIFCTKMINADSSIIAARPLDCVVRCA
jgi:hypothetical protein